MTPEEFIEQEKAFCKRHYKDELILAVHVKKSDNKEEVTFSSEGKLIQRMVG